MKTRVTCVYDAEHFTAGKSYSIIDSFRELQIEGGEKVKFVLQADDYEMRSIYADDPRFV